MTRNRSEWRGLHNSEADAAACVAIRQSVQGIGVGTQDFEMEERGFAGADLCTDVRMQELTKGCH